MSTLVKTGKKFGKARQHKGQSSEASQKVNNQHDRITIHDDPEIQTPDNFCDAVLVLTRHLKIENLN